MLKVETFYTQNYSKENRYGLCMSIAYTIIQVYFTTTVVSNEVYEKDIFKLIKKLIIKNLLANKQDIEFNKELSLYIFKQEFKNIFKNLSEYLMKEVAYSNTDVINFLKYYSLDTIVIGQMRYKVPQITEADGERWNVTSMLSILKSYVKTQEQIDILEKNKRDIEVNISSYFVKELDPISHNLKIQERYEELELRIQKNTSQITIIYDSLAIQSKVEDLERTNIELDIAQKNRMQLRDEKSLLTKSKIKQQKMLEYNSLVKQVQSLQRDLSPMYKIITQNQDAYTSIKNALIKALISKKQAI